MKPRTSPLAFSSNAQSLGIPIFIQRLRERLVFHSQKESPDVLVERLQTRTHGKIGIVARSITEDAACLKKRGGYRSK